LDLRRASSSPNFAVPNDLSTGCYDGVTSDKTPGVGKCVGRVTHNTLNKDKGTIDEVTGKTSSPTTVRGQIGPNFENAVRGAIVETRRQWADFRAELEIEYGARRASLMICALTRDDPVKSCQGRKVAIVIDSSGSNTETDPSNLRIAAAQAFNSMLITEADAGPDGLPDRVTVVDFDGSARVIYPLGDPSRASFDIDSSGDTFIAGGVAAAIGELTKDPNDPTADRTGIVVLTDGEDSDIFALVGQINRAQSLGIRVAFGFLSPPANPVRKRSAELQRREPPAELVTAILKTGGFFSKIYSAETQRAFIDLVITHGPTNFDNAKGDNNGGPLSPGLAVSGLASAASGPDVYTYHGLRGDQLTFTIQSNHQSLKAVVRDVRASVVIKECTTDAQGKAQITFTVSKEADFELVISTTDEKECVYSVNLEVSPKCDQCPCNGPGTPQCFTTSITSSTTLFYVSTFCIPALSPPSVTTPTPSPPLNSLSTTTPLLSPPSVSVSQPNPISPGTSLCSTTTVFKPTTIVQPVTICSTPPSTFITRSPSLSPSTVITRTPTSLHRNLLASGNIRGTLASKSDADTKPFRVFVALICIIAVQSVMILGALIWWFCSGKGKRGAYTSLQDDGRTKFIPEWMPSWTPRNGYSKPGENAPLYVFQFSSAYLTLTEISILSEVSRQLNPKRKTGSECRSTVHPSTLDFEHISTNHHYLYGACRTCI